MEATVSCPLSSPFKPSPSGGRRMPAPVLLIGDPLRSQRARLRRGGRSAAFAGPSWSWTHPHRPTGPQGCLLVGGQLIGCSTDEPCHQHQRGRGKPGPTLRGEGASRRLTLFCFCFGCLLSLAVTHLLAAGHMARASLCVLRCLYRAQLGGFG